MIVSNWHSVVVQFSVAFLVAATVMLLVAVDRRTTTGPNTILLSAGRTMFWIGASALLLTIITGVLAYYSVEYAGPSHSAMSDHGIWAYGTFVVIIIAVISVKRSHFKALSTLTMTLLLLSTGLVLVSAYKGGGLVYSYRLCVMPTPCDPGESCPRGDRDSSQGPAIVNQEVVDDHDNNGEHFHFLNSLEETVHTRTEGNARDYGKETAKLKLTPKEVAVTLPSAIKAGNKELVRELLHEDVLVMETGNAHRGRDDYMNGLMLSDMAFLKNMTIETINQTVAIDGDLAWVTTEMLVTGTFNGRDIDETSEEFLIIREGREGWQVTHIYWEN